MEVQHVFDVFDEVSMQPLALALATEYSVLEGRLHDLVIDYL